MYYAPKPHFSSLDPPLPMQNPEKSNAIPNSVTRTSSASITTLGGTTTENRNADQISKLVAGLFVRRIAAAPRCWVGLGLLLLHPENETSLASGHILPDLPRGRRPNPMTAGPRARASRICILIYAV